MSWGQYFDQSGSYADDVGKTGTEYYQDSYGDTASAEGGYSDFGQQKRPKEDDSQGSKKQKTDYGSFDTSANEAVYSADMDWSHLSQITSWDQLSSPGGNKSNNNRGNHGKDGRGRGKGGRGSYGNFGDSFVKSSGSSDNGSFGKRSGNFDSGSFGKGFGSFDSGNTWGSGSQQDDGQFPEDTSSYSGGYGGSRGGARGGGRGGRGNKRGSWDNQNQRGSGGQSNNYGGGSFSRGGGRGNSRGGGERGGNTNRGYSGGFGGSYDGGQSSGRGGSRGRGRGTKSYGVLRPEASTMSLVHKFEQLIQFLQGDVMRINAIQSIENACTALGLGLKCQYISDEFPRIHNRLIFSGCLSINGIFLTRAVGLNKKDIKHEVYSKALDVLTTKTVKDINELKDPGVETVKMCIERILKQSRPKYSEGIGIPTNTSITDIVAKIQESLDSVRLLQIGLGKLLNYLKGPQKMPDNPISQLEQSMIASKCGLRHMFQLNTITENEVPKFEGEFILEDTCIARATDSNKKVCKTETYAAALEALTTKQVTDLVIPVTKDDVEDEDEEQEKNEAIVAGVDQLTDESPPAVVKPSMRDASMVDRLNHLINVLASSAFSDMIPFIINNCVLNSGLACTFVYKKPEAKTKQCVACEFYVEQYLVAIGTGASKQDCMIDACNTAYDVLSSSTADNLMINAKTMPPIDSMSNVLDVVHKGEKTNFKESNTTLMHHYGFQSIDHSKNISDMVIVETSLWQTDRKAFSFAILQKSASMNGMLLQWTFSTIAPQKTYYKHESKPVNKQRCQIFLKGKKVSEHIGYGKNKTRNFAATDILSHLYETSDVVQVVQRSEETKWISCSDIEADAANLRIGKKEETPAASPGEADPFMMEVLQERLNDFFPRNDCEELIIGPGLRDVEKNKIRKYARSLNVLMELRQQDGKQNCALYCKPDMRQVVAALNSKGPDEQYGRFVLVPRQKLPKHSDVIKNSTVPTAISS